MAVLTDFTWLVGIAIVFSFSMAFGIGANDVANAFGSSVAAKSLSLGQAIIVASTFEFLGAVSIGQSVAGTIRNKIVDAEFYEERPDLLMFGMSSALIVGSIWLLTATYYEFPVSTTHDIIGAIIGFSLAAYGAESVDWKNVGTLIGSWIAAPLFTGTISFIFYYPVKTFVMDHENSFDRAVKVYPIVVFIGIAVNAFFVLFKMKDQADKVDNWGMVVVLPVALGGGFLCALITYLFIAPYLQKTVNAHVEQKEKDRAEAIEDASNNVKKDSAEEDEEDDILEIDVDTMVQTRSSGKKFIENDMNISKPKKDDFEGETILKDPISATRNENTMSLHAAAWDYFAKNTYKQDLKAQSLSENKGAATIWENSTVYDERTERLFSYLQVFTACLTSFAHGGNDVANAIAPLAAVLSIWETGEVSSKAPVPKWTLAMGGAALGLGFTFFGYRIIKAVGYKLTCISPSRGFCIELATAMAVSTASFIGLPVSSTQCLVGSTVGAGLASGGFKQVQWRYLARTMVGWAGMFWIVVAVNCGFFAYSIYSPNNVANFVVVPEPDL